MMKFGVRVAEWLAHRRERQRQRVRKGQEGCSNAAEGERQLSAEGLRPGDGSLGYTFEYINVCKLEFVLEWASAILSGGY